MKITVTITGAEEKALLTDMLSIENWMSNAIHNKARQCMDVIITEYSDKQPKKTPASKREAIVLGAVVESAAERQAKVEAELK